MGAAAIALPFFALTLFVSAFLLFLVQPMIGKMILPRLGGTPQVWNTCMVFFQMSLLAGYAYTHLISTRLKLRGQLILHGLLLLFPLLMLYGLGSFYSRIEDFKPIYGGNPIPMALGLLLTLVGIPFFVVATSAPLLQRWFAYTGHPEGSDPYFLYGASNLGSFLSLLAYPLVLEPIIGLEWQSWTWTIGYTLLVVLVFGCIAMVFSSPPSVALPGEKEVMKTAPKEAPPKEAPKETGVKAGAPPGRKSTSFKKGGKQRKGAKGKQKTTGAARKEEPSFSTSAPARSTSDARLGPVTPLRRLRWVALTAIPSSLMLGVTTYATTDLSPIPLLWIIPLMLYLISFVLVFARWPVVWVEKPHDIMVKIQPFTIALMILTLAMGGNATRMHFSIPIIVHIIAFFVTTMVCHGELAKDRPRTENLTEFYLLMSVGGMLGGMFNALVAPVLFVVVLEYGLAIFFSCLLRPRMSDMAWMDGYFEGVFGSGGGRPGSRGDRSVAAADVPRMLDYFLPIAVLVLLVLLTFLAGEVIQSVFQSVFSVGETDAMVALLVFVYVLGLLASLLFMERPIRYGLTVGAILLIVGIYTPGTGGETVYRDRSYFGVLKVNSVPLAANVPRPYTSLIHGHINHGMNFRQPSDTDEHGDKDKDLSRLATTYYHRLGPAGRVMELYNWFPGPLNTYWADARMPASLVALGGTPLSLGALPVDQIVGLWSEPPYATIGLGTGTMASYARPFQHMHYYEIDNHIVRMSVPGPTGPYLNDSTKEPFFTYLRDAKERGVCLWILMGDARLRMAEPFSKAKGYTFSDWSEAVVKEYYNNPYDIMIVDGDVGGGPDNFYFMMVVDAFSSDAIPVHLITKEAIEMYFDKLTLSGILCVHTSNRYVDLVPVVADIAKGVRLKKRTETGSFVFERDSKGKYVLDEDGNKVHVYEDVALKAWHGDDNAPGGDRSRDPEAPGHFQSQWVMVARSDEAFTVSYTVDGVEKVKRVLEPPEGYRDKLRIQYDERNWDFSLAEPYWQPAQTSGRRPWTDDFSNLIAAIRWQ